MIDFENSHFGLDFDQEDSATNDFQDDFMREDEIISDEEQVGEQSFADVDGDGYKETTFVDIDEDGDGYAETHLMHSDTDGDGVDDYHATFVEYDSNNSGVVDTMLAEVDSDGDQVIDKVVKYNDYNQDGGYDNVKVYSDTDGDGEIDTVEKNYDSDGDGVIDTTEVYVDESGNGDADLHLIYDYDSDKNLVLLSDDYDYDYDYEAYYIEMEQYDPSTVVDPEMVLGNPEDSMDYWEYQGEDGPCALYAQMFVIEELSGQDIDIDAFVDEAYENGWYDGNGTPILDMNLMLDSYGIDNEMGFNKSIDDIMNCLDDGGKVIVSLDANQIWFGEDGDIFSPMGAPNHAVEVIGVDYSDPNNPMVILNDSGHPDGQGELVPLDVFESAWSEGDCQMIACYPS